jgi:predicted AAA+ superfamily ATPase
MYIKRVAEETIQSLLNDSKVIILLGARQVGKTTLIEPFVRQKQGLLLNCDIAIDKAKLLAAASLPPQEAMRLLGTPSLLIIDEAQNLPEIGQIVKGWYDFHINTKIVLLGSSSLNLLDLAAEPLTGRNEKIYLTPLLFSEILKNQSWYSPYLKKSMITEQFKEQLSTILMQQMVFGSYPEAVTSLDKEKYLLNLTSDYLLRDVLHGGLVKSPEVVKKLLQLLAYQAGSEVSINELAQNLQIARQTVERYLELLERSYVIFRVHAFNTNQRKEIAKNSKIFFWDTGVRNALLKEFSMSEARSDIGSLFENWVISEVAKKNLTEGDRNTIYFWRKRDGAEVDLVIKGTDTFKAYEIKWTKRSLTSSIKSFTQIYNIPVEVITKNNVLNILA